MERPRIIRFLKLGWTAFCVIACVAFITLWVRSFTAVDSIYGPITSERAFYIDSVLGRLGIGSSLIPNEKPRPFEIFSVSLELISRDSLNLEGGLFGLRFDTNQFAWTIILPYWFLLCVAIVLAAVPWLRWRFSLRTLLIAITLIAVLLGLLYAVQ